MSPTKTAAPAWHRVGAVPPRDLKDARLQAHHATQIVVSAAISWLAPRDDDSHTSLTWSDPLSALLTEPLTPAGGRFGLQGGEFALIWVPDGITAAAAFSLHGRTVTDALAWVRSLGTKAGLDASAFTSRKHYEIPHYPIVDGGAFDGRSHAGFRELDHYWRNASLLLRAIAAREPGASAVRCWPHHFDIATLITLPRNGSPTARTIGVGHEPGDGYYAEPYWYVSPSPDPTDTSALPTLDGGGRWHTTGWVGAVLLASDYVKDSVDAQHQRVAAFTEGAIGALK